MTSLHAGFFLVFDAIRYSQTLGEDPDVLRGTLEELGVFLRKDQYKVPKSCNRARASCCFSYFFFTVFHACTC